MPAIPDPQAATAKWVQNLGTSTTAVTRGVNAVTTAPGQAAAAQADKWLARVTASQAKWKSRVASVSVESWRASMINIGIPRMSQGAQAKQQKYTDFAAQFFPHLAAGQAKVASMPSTSLEDGINRAVTMIRHNASFKRS